MTSKRDSQKTKKSYFERILGFQNHTSIQKPVHKQIVEISYEGLASVDPIELIKSPSGRESFKHDRAAGKKLDILLPSDDEGNKNQPVTEEA